MAAASLKTDLQRFLERYIHSSEIAPLAGYLQITNDGKPKGSTDYSGYNFGILDAKKTGDKPIDLESPIIKLARHLDGKELTPRQLAIEESIYRILFAYSSVEDRLAAGEIYKYPMPGSPGSRHSSMGSPKRGDSGASSRSAVSIHSAHTAFPPPAGKPFAYHAGIGATGKKEKEPDLSTPLLGSTKGAT